MGLGVATEFIDGFLQKTEVGVETTKPDKGERDEKDGVHTEGPLKVEIEEDLC
jgi:hypothetical protein